MYFLIFILYNYKLCHFKLRILLKYNIYEEKKIQLRITYAI